MKTLVFDPYLATLGGGERYLLELAQVASEFSEVDLAAPSIPPPDVMVDRGLPTGLPGISASPHRFGGLSRGYDLTIRLTNHLPSVSRSRRSILVIQFPHRAFAWQHPLRPLRMAAILRGYECITYSQFVANWCRRRWGISPHVIYPGVEAVGFDPAAKTETILAVGRFFAGGNDKRQDVLIDAFRRLPTDIRGTWQLVLAGGARDRTAPAVLAALRDRAKGLRVRFEPDVPGDRLKQLYREASVFWHAAGCGRRRTHPEAAEHFGMSTVEAMSAGCVPVVFDDGGQREVLVDTQMGVRWSTMDDLVGSTVQLVERPGYRTEMASAAFRGAERFSPERFTAAARHLLAG